MSEELETRSNPPIIGLDGPDANGVRAEVKILTGYGHVESITPSGNGNSNNVVFVVSNNKYKSSGWVPTNSEVFKKIQEAKESGTPIHYRLENKRKDHVDRSLPMSVIAPPNDMTAAKENIFKSLAAVSTTGESGDWTISDKALTRIDEDPRPGGGYSAYDHSLEELRGANVSPSATSATSTGTWSRHSLEGTPFSTYNSNGDINPGSTAVSVPLNTYNFVAEWVRTHDDVNFTEKQTILVTKAIIITANRLQKDIYDGKLETADLSLGSHTRARALVFDITRNFFPITNETVKDKKSLQSWSDDVHSKALAMWKWSIEEVAKLLA